MLVAVAAGFGIGKASASGSTPPSFAWLKPTPTPTPFGWMLLVPPSGNSLLWYPPSMKPINGDPYSVSAALKDRSGQYVAYLNAGPRTGNEKMSNWPSSRIDRHREERESSVHEDSQASGLGFRGGRGSCVIDDYVTRVGAHDYREIACFVQGRTAASVIVAAALKDAWPKYGPILERAVASWQVA